MRLRSAGFSVQFWIRIIRFNSKLAAPLISIVQMYSQGLRSLSVLKLGKNYTHRAAG